jgi:hypothetical protein
MGRHLALGAIAYFAIALVQIPAVVGWGWSAAESHALFVGVPLFFLLLGSIIGAAKAISRRLYPHNPG